MQEQFDMVKAARSWLAEQVQERADERTRTPSVKTVELYQREIARLLAAGDPWKAAANTTKKATYFFRRAAILHFCRANIEAGLKAQDRLQRDHGLNDPVKKAAWDKEVYAIKNALKLVQKTPDEPPLAKKQIERRQTKRVDLWKLPGNWRETIIARMPKYALEAAVCALCGCRPVELERDGVAVSMKNGQLKLRILGAKLGLHSGQEWRELVWDMPTTNPLAMLVGRMALENSGEVLVKTPSAKAFSGAMRSAGRRAFPDFSHEITPYSMRHQVASDLKAAELPGGKISQALGHRASDTKGSYGEWGGGSGGMAPDCISAASDVKPKPLALALPGLKAMP